ncbi:MAG: sigma-70 family RNA polymerase sigma factor [Thermoanaerobaculia bacterium]
MSSREDRDRTARRILAELAAGGPREAGLSQLFSLYYATVEHFFRLRGVDAEGCRDLTQETFFRIFRSWESFRGQASFATWLFTVATNLWRERVRGERAQKRSAPEVSLDRAAAQDAEPLAERLASGQPPASAELLEEERSRQLRRAVEALPEQMRRCLILRVYHDLRYREIAKVMGLSVETVKAHLSQARRRLRAELGPEVLPAGDLEEADP